MIRPSEGRIVWFFPMFADSPDDRPFAALLAGINADDTINLTVSARDGSTYPVQNVKLLQDGETGDRTQAAHAEWMPYQKGQAQKAESAEGSVASTVSALEKSTDERFTALGEYLEKTLGGIVAEISALKQPPAAAPAPTPPSTNGAGGADQQQQQS